MDNSASKNVLDSPAGNLSWVHPNRHFLRKTQIFVAHRAFLAGLLEDGVLQPDPVHAQTSGTVQNAELGVLPIIQDTQ